MNDLGTTYRSLGMLQADQYLQASYEILEKASRSIDRKQSPMLFIRVQQNLGLTIREIGIKEGSIPRLLESVTAFSEVLHLASRDTSPILWAAIQFHLAKSYFEIAKRSHEPDDFNDAHDAIAKALPILAPPRTGPLPKDARQLADEMGRFLSEEDSTQNPA